MGLEAGGRGGGHNVLHSVVKGMSSVLNLCCFPSKDAFPFPFIYSPTVIKETVGCNTKKNGSAKGMGWKEVGRKSNGKLEKVRWGLSKT